MVLSKFLIFTAKITITNMTKPTIQFIFSVRSRYIQIYLLLAIVSITILSFLAYQTPHFSFDLPITRQVQSLNSPVTFNLFSAMSWIGYNPQIEIITLIIISIIFLSGFIKAAYISSVNAVITLLVSITIKNYIHRSRPTTDLVQVFKHLPDYGFPSGHVLFYTSFFGFIFYLVYLHMKPSFLKKILLTVIALLIVSIAPSRIFLGAHWASDTLASYLLGSILLLLTINLYHHQIKDYSSHQDT